MKNLPINKEVIISRMIEIEKDYNKLSQFKDFSIDEFKKEENFAIAEHYLRRALEAVFDIGNHMLSRVSGLRVTTYKDIAINLGKINIVQKEFADQKLLKMAGYRNRLIHFYSEITVEEIYKIIQFELNDFMEFLKYIKKVIEDPELYGFSIS